MPSLSLLDTNAGPTCSSDWHDIIAVGDVVMYRFPAAESDPAELPKIRPCLVVERHDADGHPRVVLAYGTTSPQRPRGPYDVIVADRAHAPSAGLHRRTLFQVDRTLSVSLASAAFDLSARTGSPLIGRLEGRELQRLQCVRARLHAEADMAAERRREHARRGQDRRRGGEPRCRATPTLHEPRWRAIPEQPRPVVEHRRGRAARPSLRLVAASPVPASPSSKPMSRGAPPTVGSARPTLTVRRPTPTPSTMNPEVP